jgi:uncharacterized protein YecT (DUF1311 family)
MRFASISVCAAVALALGGCHRPEKLAGGPSRTAAEAPPRSRPLTRTSTPLPASTAAPDAAATVRPEPAASARSPLSHRFRPPTRAVGRAPIASGTIPARSFPASATLPALRRASDPTRAEDGFSPDYESCLDGAGGFTEARAACHSAELTRQSARVERALSALLAVRSGEARARLRKDQMAWLEQRDAECRDDASGAALDVLQEGSCRLDMTARRAAKLEKMNG